MATRHDAREWAIQILFQWDFNSGDLDRMLAQFWEDRKPAPGARAFTEEVARGTIAHLAEIDDMLRRYAENWSLQRMAAVDRNIMRVALYEMLYRRDIPPVVSINEAVEFAKKLGDAQSGKFVNGILDRARKDIDRPARTAGAELPPGPETEHEKLD